MTSGKAEYQLNSESFASPLSEINQMENKARIKPKTEKRVKSEDPKTRIEKTKGMTREIFVATEAMVSPSF